METNLDHIQNTFFQYNFLFHYIHFFTYLSNTLYKINSSTYYARSLFINFFYVFVICFITLYIK